MRCLSPKLRPPPSLGGLAGLAAWRLIPSYRPITRNCCVPGMRIRATGRNPEDPKNRRELGRFRGIVAQLPQDIAQVSPHRTSPSGHEAHDGVHTIIEM